ncbi:unnamed protein product [Cylicostephanus goldi]|uniref:Helicase C-terminal domain-containing protein n=1 Tax=Cylicostephanus goldi TaxID=71465 RepID=A0A3P6SS49_CYLGO|nr:unnamed protein product [Cylicostephanus goldi]
MNWRSLVALKGLNAFRSGIDIKDVSLVLNYDMAKSIEDYTHRIGRTEIEPPDVIGEDPKIMIRCESTIAPNILEYCAVDTREMIEFTYEFNSTASWLR